MSNSGGDIASSIRKQFEGIETPFSFTIVSSALFAASLPLLIMCYLIILLVDKNEECLKTVWGDGYTEDNEGQVTQMKEFVDKSKFYGGLFGFGIGLFLATFIETFQAGKIGKGGKAKGYVQFFLGLILSIGVIYTLFKLYFINEKACVQSIKGTPCSTRNQTINAFTVSLVTATLLRPTMQTLIKKRTIHTLYKIVGFAFGILAITVCHYLKKASKDLYLTCYGTSDELYEVKKSIIQRTLSSSNTSGDDKDKEKNSKETKIKELAEEYPYRLDVKIMLMYIRITNIFYGSEDVGEDKTDANIVKDIHNLSHNLLWLLYPFVIVLGLIFVNAQNVNWGSKFKKAIGKKVQERNAAMAPSMNNNLVNDGR